MPRKGRSVTGPQGGPQRKEDMVTDALTHCPHGFVGPWTERPCGCKLVEVAHSEVAMHMCVAGSVMWASLCVRIGNKQMLSANIVQLYTLDNKPFSAPVLRGEAGYDRSPVG